MILCNLPTMQDTYRMRFRLGFIALAQFPIVFLPFAIKKLRRFPTSRTEERIRTTQPHSSMVRNDHVSQSGPSRRCMDP